MIQIDIDTHGRNQADRGRDGQTARPKDRKPGKEADKSSVSFTMHIRLEGCTNRTAKILFVLVLRRSVKVSSFRKRTGGEAIKQTDRYRRIQHDLA